MIQVLVCVPGAMNVAGLGSCLPSGTMQSTPIGYLRGFESAELIDNEMVAEELEALGLELKYLGCAAKAEHGCRAAVIAFAVEVETLEAAQRLAGFVPFGEIAGPLYLPPPKLSTLALADRFQSIGDDEGFVARIPATDLYDNFEPPPYGGAGEFVLSPVPHGSVETLVFLQEDPAYIYLFWGHREGRKPDSVDLARRTMASFRKVGDQRRTE